MQLAERNCFRSEHEPPSVRELEPESSQQYDYVGHGKGLVVDSSGAYQEAEPIDAYLGLPFDTGDLPVETFRYRQFDCNSPAAIDQRQKDEQQQVLWDKTMAHVVRGAE